MAQHGLSPGIGLDAEGWSKKACNRCQLTLGAGGRLVLPRRPTPRLQLEAQWFLGALECRLPFPFCTWENWVKLKTRTYRPVPHPEPLLASEIGIQSQALAPCGSQ